MIVYQNFSIIFIRNKFQLNVSENSKQYQIFMSTFSSLIWKRTAEYFLDFRSCRKILGNSQIVKMHHLNLSSSLCKSSGSRQKALLILWTKILSYKVCMSKGRTKWRTCRLITKVSFFHQCSDQ